MALEDAADLAGFFDTDEHAVAATFTPAGGSAVAVDGIFENEFVAVLDEAGVAVESTRPAFTCAAAGVPAVAHGDAIAIGAAVYTVVGVEPDGTGVVKLILEAP